MKKFALLTATALMFSDAASAADLPLKAASLPPAFLDWSGAYIGVHAGYGGGMKDWANVQQAFDFQARGFLGGAQIGFNKQIASLVFGVELDGSWADIKGSQTQSFSGAAFGGSQLNFSASSRVDGLLTFAGRAGLAADRWFVFAKAGIAGAWERHALNQTGFVAVVGGGPNLLLGQFVSGDEYRWGSMVGFGAEYAIDRHWSVKAEYDYIHFNSNKVELKGSDPFGPVTVNQPISQDAVHIAKIGANYRWSPLSVDPAYSPVPAAPGTNWTGAFVGVQAGYGGRRDEWPDFEFMTVSGSGKFDTNGWLAGFNGGVNVQSGSLVFGVEGEWMWTGMRGGQSFTVVRNGVTDAIMLRTSVDWLALATARAGFVVGDRLLLYGKGGVAIASERHSTSEAQTLPGVGTLTKELDAKAIHSGVVAGVGAEYALGRNWSIKGEYDYIRLVAQNFTGLGSGFLNAPGAGIVGPFTLGESHSTAQQDLNLVKLGVNYRFDPVPGVVTARY